MAPVHHVVFLKFSKAASSEDIAETCEGILAYRHSCLNPITREPLLTSAVGGVNCGTEQLDAGFTHAFVLSFASVQDLRLYLVNEHHVNFDIRLESRGILEEEMVLDFSPGAF